MTKFKPWFVGEVITVANDAKLNNAARSGSMVKRSGKRLTTVLKAAGGVPPWPFASAKETACQNDKLLHITYTSGSTGKPKGVPAFECGILNFVVDQIRRLPLSSADVVVAQTGLGWDPHDLDLYAPSAP